ncbi:MAG: alpha/beta hydrolase [Xanthobacteraceae bacterium]|jgi:predicted alpha/beta hydrolase family esterase
MSITASSCAPKAAEPPILVAHSLACLLVAHWAARGNSRNVQGGFLVAVPDPDGSSFPKVEAALFRAVPEITLPFPALVVASNDDP